MRGLNIILSPVRPLLLTCLAAVLLVGGARAADSDDDFGRFFTTPKQRERLDELRKSTSSIVINVKDEELNLDQDVKKVEQQNNAIKLKGIVTRSDGKNTAWINDSNTYEGDPASAITRVKEHEISSSGIKLDLPGDKKSVHLKVGEAYDSAAGKTDDILPKDDIVK